MLGPYLASAAFAITVAAPAVSFARDAVAAKRPRSSVRAGLRREPSMARARVRAEYQRPAPFINSPTHQLTNS